MFSKSRIFSGEISVVEFCCCKNITLAVHINFTSLRDNVDGVGSVSACVRRWTEPNFRVSRVDRVDPQNFGKYQKSGRGQNFSVGGTYDFINFYFDSMTFYL